MGLRTTQALLAKALRGNDGAEGDLLERLRPRLVLWSTARMSSQLRARVEPEDLAQEVLLAVHEALPDFTATGTGSFLPWLFTVAENRIRDAARFFGAKKRQPGPPPSFSQTSPSEAYVRREDVVRLKQAIDGLSDAHREVIRLRRLEDRPDAEVAHLMSRSENAVRVLYCRAVKALRGAMNEAT